MLLNVFFIYAHARCLPHSQGPPGISSDERDPNTKTRFACFCYVTNREHETWRDVVLQYKTKFASCYISCSSQPSENQPGLLSALMENRSNQCKPGEESLLERDSQTRSEALDKNKYMDIDEFMNVLREVELITPFGKVQDTSHTGLHQVGFQTLELLTRDTERNDFRSGRIIPRTPTVMQVLETERTLRDVHPCKPLPYSKQHSEKIVEDSVMTNYLSLLLSQNRTTTGSSW